MADPKVTQTGTVMRRDEAGALIECRSYRNEETNVCWTEEVVIEPAPPPPEPPEEAPAEDAETE